MPVFARHQTTLLFLAAVPGGFYNSTQLQKGLYLVETNLPQVLDDPHEFQPGSYGPNCKQIFDDVRVLEEEQLAHTFSDRSSYLSHYIATHKGFEIAERLNYNVSKRDREYIKCVSEWVLRLSWRDLVASMIRQFPHMHQ